MSQRASLHLQARRRGGFTLLELILAVGISTMLLGALYMTLNVVHKARASAYASVAPIRAVLQAVDVIRQDMDAIEPPGLIENNQLSGEFVGAVQNGSGFLDFYCIGNDAGWAMTRQNSNAQAGPGGIGAARGGSQTPIPNADIPWTEGSRHVQYGLQQIGNGTALVRAVTRNLLAIQVPDPDVEIICRNVTNFSLQYFDGTQWDDEWDSTAVGNVLPSAVKLQLEVMLDDRPGEAPRPYRVTRVFVLPCAKPLDTTTDGGGM